MKVQKVSFLPKELADWVLIQMQPVEVKNFKVKYLKQRKIALLTIGNLWGGFLTDKRCKELDLNYKRPVAPIQDELRRIGELKQA